MTVGAAAYAGYGCFHNGEFRLRDAYHGATWGMFAGGIGRRVSELPTFTPGGRVNEAYYRARLWLLEKRSGTKTVHSFADHGKWTTRQLQGIRVLTRARPSTGAFGRPTRFASRFFANREHFLLLREGVRRQHRALRDFYWWSAGGMPEDNQVVTALEIFGENRTIGEVVERIASLNHPQGVKWYDSMEAIIRFDSEDLKRFYTAYPNY